VRLSVSVLVVLVAGLVVRPRDWAWIATGEMTTVTSRKKKIRFKMYTPGNCFELSFGLTAKVCCAPFAVKRPFDIRVP
jgi:hypothetical protein